LGAVEGTLEAVFSAAAEETAGSLAFAAAGVPGGGGRLELGIESLVPVLVTVLGGGGREVLGTEVEVDTGAVEVSAGALVIVVSESTTGLGGGGRLLLGIESAF
jgi:hypothetical protein